MIQKQNLQSNRTIPVGTANENSGETRPGNTNLRNRFTNLSTSSEGSRPPGWMSLGPQVSLYMEKNIIALFF